MDAQYNQLRSEIFLELSKIQKKNETTIRALDEIREQFAAFRMDIEGTTISKLRKLVSESTEKALRANEITLGKVAYIEAAFNEIEDNLLQTVRDLDEKFQPLFKLAESMSK
jgi:hypothetical protein